MTLYPTIIIGILSLMLVILGWLVNKVWSDSKENNHRIYTQLDNLNSQITRLGDSITGLNGIIMSQGEKFIGNEKACDLRHSTIKEKIDNHEKRITEHGKEIDSLKIKISK